MLNLSQSYVLGVDVAKEDLVVFDGEKHYKVKNVKGLRRLETIIRKHVGDDFGKVIISYEPTGGYSNHLVRFCSEKGIKTLKVNPYRASHFFKSQRIRGKNDDQDAENLRKLVFVIPEEVKETIIDEKAERLKSLIRVYETISKSIVRWKNSLAHRKKYYKTENREEIEAIKSIIRVLQKKEKVIVKKINELIKSDGELQKRREYIRSMYGVGEKTSMVLLGFFLMYPNSSRSQIVSLAGLDVINSSSGKSIKRKGKISKRGSRAVRRMLFIAAMNLANRNEKFKKIYENFLKRGKSKMTALTAISRKVLLITRALFLNMTVYVEDYKNVVL